MVSKLSKIWSRMFILDPDLWFLPIPDPRSRGSKSTRSWIWIRNIALLSIVIFGSGINIPDFFGQKGNDLLWQKKSLYQFKTFCFDLYVFVLSRNVPLCKRHFPDQIKLFCFVPESLGQYRNDLLLINFFLDQIKMFCFVPEPMGQKGKNCFWYK